MDLKHRIQFVWPGPLGMSECCTSAAAHYIWTSLGGRGGAGRVTISAHHTGLVLGLVLVSADLARAWSVLPVH